MCVFSWMIFPVQLLLLPSRQVNHVRCFYLAIEGNILTVKENPIAKIPLSVHSFNGDLQVSTLVIENDDNDTNDNGSPFADEPLQNQWEQKYDCDISTSRVQARRSNNKQLEALTSHILQLQAKNKGKPSRILCWCNQTQ